jgi:CspA family cold shock protein
MNRGTIVRWVKDRGFGFIKRDEGGTNLFAHINDVVNAEVTTLNKGQRVQFEIGSDERSGRPKAQRITLL